MSSSDKKPCLPLPPADRSFDVKEDLTEAQQGMLQALLDHFSKGDYSLARTENGALIEEEKFWLVRFCGIVKGGNGVKRGFSLESAC
jgi:hypothetical protein